MKERDRMREVFTAAQARHAAVAGIRVHSFVEAEAALEAAADAREPVIVVASAAHKNLEPFIRALQWLASTGRDVFVQLAGDAPEDLARAAKELEVDAVYFARGGAEAVRVLCDALRGTGILTEAVLPVQEAVSEGVPEGWVVDREAARSVVALEGLDMAAVPVGGGPGPYKSWRIPLWSVEAFNDVKEMRGDLFYALPWASLLPKELLARYNTYGGALPGVISMPHQQFRGFIANGVVKVNFRSDPALAFLAGMRESLFRRPEDLDITVHLMQAKDSLVEFLRERLADLRP